MKALCEVSQFPSHTLEAAHERNRSCPVSSRPNSHWHVRWQPEGHASNGIGCSGHPRNPPEIATFFGKEGGAIAHGHPIGASGAVLTTRLLCVFHPNSATHNDRNPPPVTTPSRPPIPPAKPPPIPIKKPARSAGSEFRYKNRRSCAERCAPSPQPAHRLPLEFHPMRSAH